MEIKDQEYTNAYLTEMIAHQVNHVQQERYWIGGLRNYIAGKKFDVWYDSADMLNFDGFPRNDYRTNILQNIDEDMSYGITIRSAQNTS